MRLVVGLEGLAGVPEVLDGVACGRALGVWVRVRGAPAAEEALHCYAGVGGAEGELGEAPGEGLLFEGGGEVVEFWVEGRGVADASGYLCRTTSLVLV